MSSDGKKEFAKEARSAIKGFKKEMNEQGRVIAAIGGLSLFAIWVLDQYIGEDSDNED